MIIFALCTLASLFVSAYLCLRCLQVTEQKQEASPAILPDVELEIMPKYEDIESEYEMSEVYTGEDEAILMNVVMSGDIHKAAAVIENFFDQINPNNKEMVNYLVTNMIRTFVKLIANIKIKNDSSKYKFENMIGIIKLESAHAMMEAIIEISRELCLEIKLIKPDSGESVSKRVMEYVENNYSDHDLDVSKISEYLNFSPSYSIKLFKQETGEGISNYINKTRVEKAKELLLLDIYRVEQIAKMVGFTDSRALSRSFKKFYGVTPTQYREISTLETNNP